MKGSGMTKTKAQIFNSKDKCMPGAELKRLRELAGLTQEQLAEQMYASGWYRQKVVDYEHSAYFCLNPAEMQALLDTLGASRL